jgi:hypothetical protein
MGGRLAHLAGRNAVFLRAKANLRAAFNMTMPRGYFSMCVQHCTSSGLRSSAIYHLAVSPTLYYWCLDFRGGQDTMAMAIQR